MAFDQNEAEWKNRIHMVDPNNFGIKSQLTGLLNARLNLKLGTSQGE